MRKALFRGTLLCILFALLLSGGASAEIFHKKGDEPKRIALTFDDGPSEKTTDEILSILERFGVKATFFVIGKNAENNPKKIKKIFDAGHEIGNHTYTHAYINKLSEDKLREEIEKTENILKEITGQKPVVFRPPGGAYNDASISFIEKMGYKCALWSVDTRDWSMPKTDKVVSIIENQTCGGDILLFHDLEHQNNPTPPALEIIIPYLIEQGYEFVSVSELVE